MPDFSILPTWYVLTILACFLVPGALWIILAFVRFPTR